MRAGLVLSLTAGVAATVGGPTAHAAPCPPAAGVKQVAVGRGAPVVDGHLDDPVWARACFVTDFAQGQPRFGAAPSHPVAVAATFDDDTLYIAARIGGRRAEIDDALTQRDDTAQAERFIVSLDPAQTRRVAYSFAVTAAGVRADWIHTDDTTGARDASWNPVWQARTVIGDDGWTAELAIPLSQLRLPSAPTTTWGVNFNWYVPHSQEDVFWIPVPRDKTAWASMFGALTELPPRGARLTLELLPYAATRLAIDEAPAGAFGRRLAPGLEAGLDLKLRPTPALTIAGTVNPDFGQVDADPAIVNLTAYEVRLPERRPFFVEAAPLFKNEGGNYFYSRRIGALPRTLPTADAIDLPAQVQILGAATIAGEVAPRTQVAALGAVTAQTDTAAIVGGAPTTLAVAPVTGWAAARLERQLGASVVGATATAVGRALDGTGLPALLPASALVGGGDAKLRTASGTYELDLAAGASTVAGSAAAMTLLQRASAHMFQRPDATHVRVDPTARRLTGWHGNVTGQKREGAWQGDVYVNAESPSYEVNDLGALTSADDLDVGLDLSRQATAPGKRLYGWSLGGGAYGGWNFGGMRKPVDLSLAASATTLGFSTASLNVDVTTPGRSDDLTRGGPMMATGWATAIVAAASTPGGRARQLSGAVEVDVSPTLQQGISGHLTYTSRVLPALRLDATPSVTAIEHRRQYVATVADPGAATYGARYVFGHLHRREAALELRATWSLSPDLVVTLYAQPFVSAGRYDDFGDLAAASAADLRPYATAVHGAGIRALGGGGATVTVAEPDYTVVSLRSTAVVRWELAPGSTLFVVWQQARGGADPFARALHDAAPDVFTRAAVHTLAVKLSYWFG